MRKSQEPVKGSVFIEQQDRALSAPSFEKEWIESMIYWPGEKVSVQFLLVGRISTLLNPLSGFLAVFSHICYSLILR